jgi:hypothetical protein
MHPLRNDFGAFTFDLGGILALHSLGMTLELRNLLCVPLGMIW